VLWTLGTLPAGTSRTVQAIYDAGTVADGTILTATAAVADAAGDRARAATSTTFHSTVAAQLMVALTGSADPVPTGDELGYTIRFGNRGTSALLNSQLAVALPPGTTVVDAGGGTVTAGTVTWNLTTLDPGETGERPLRVTVDDLPADPLVRVARATITSGAVAATAGLVTQVAPARLAVVMVANPEPVNPGQAITYELTVTNHGPGDAVQVQLTMPIPAGVGGGCVRLSDGAQTPDGCFNGRDVVWTFDTLSAGTSRTVQATYDALSNLPDGTVLSASASVADAAGSHARASASTTCHTAAASPLVIGLAESADPVLAGENLAYTVRLGNRGTSSVLNAQLALALPAGVTVLDAGGGVASGDTLSWDLGTLAAGATGQRVVTMKVDDLGSDDPLVRLARTTLAAGSAAASGSLVTLVEPEAPLALEMSIDFDPAAPNQLVTYHLKVTNDGSDDSVQVELRMPVPSGVSGCGMLSDGGTLPGGCFIGRDAVWQLGTLSPGTNRSVTFVVRVSSTAPAGSILSATSRVADAAGSRARAELSTAIKP